VTTRSLSRIFFLGILLAVSSTANALTITTSDGGIIITVTDTDSAYYDWSANSGGGWLTALGEGDAFCVRSGSPCSGDPPYDFVAQAVTAGADTIRVATPTGTRDTDECGITVTGTDDSDWIMGAGTTFSGTCTYVGFGGGGGGGTATTTTSTNTTGLILLSVAMWGIMGGAMFAWLRIFILATSTR